MWSLAFKTAVVILSIIGTLVGLALVIFFIACVGSFVLAWFANREQERLHKTKVAECEAIDARRRVEREIRDATIADIKANPCNGWFSDLMTTAMRTTGAPCELRKGHEDKHGRFRG